MHEPEDFAASIAYRGERRLVSPIRWTHGGRLLLAFCLRDGHPKSFLAHFISDVKRVDSHDVVIR